MNTQQRDELLQARYGDQPKPEHFIWNGQVEALLEHRSVRAFLPDPLPGGALETMVAAAQSAATSSSLHQWSVVAAESMGLGAVYLGAVYLGAMRNNARELAELLGLPRYGFVVFGLAVGTPDPARRSGIRPRPAQSVVLHHNRYDAVAADEWVDAYEDAFRRFREAQGMPPKTWLESVAYASSAPYLDGRENLRDTVRDRGYLLR